MSQLQRFKTLKPWWLVVAGLLIYAVSGWFWWNNVYQEPSRVFWGMISNSLQTPAVTRHIVQKGNDISLDQTMIMQYGVSNSVLDKTSLRQGNTTIVTEQIGLPTQEFIRYTAIKTDQKSAAGKPVDFSKVLYTWGKADVGSAQHPQSPSLFEQSALGLAGGNFVPFANLDHNDRDSLIRLSQEGQVYSIHADKAKRSVVQGRPTYTYQVDVNAVGYAALQKTLARMLGSKLLDTVDPKQYQDQPAATIEMTVDVWSRQLRTISLASQNRTETYSGYGVGRPVTVPKAQLSSQQLQDLVKAAK